ncbi:helix-turn-helix domain-containing protein [Mesobaculum littorinae]|uniref:helix-turn-helix domain-containing protein n=1 Tax=Mesobaculum littorinae TaxID=2486419 RepID=UPI0038B2FFD1
MSRNRSRAARNTSPGRCYTELRLKRARRLLMRTGPSVSEVPVACGLQSPGDFIRLYRTAFGKTPRQQGGRIA